jgi:hypothetical protein
MSGNKPVTPENTATTAEVAGAGKNSRNNGRIRLPDPSTASLSLDNRQNLLRKLRNKAKVDPTTAATVAASNAYTTDQSREALLAAARKSVIEKGSRAAASTQPLVIPPKPISIPFVNIPKPASLPITTGGRRKTRRSKKHSKKTRRRH